MLELETQGLGLEIEGRNIEVIAHSMRDGLIRSDSYELLDCVSKEPLGYFLKRLGCGEPAEKIEEYLEIHSMLKALGIPLEPVSGTYAGRQGYVINKKVGCSINRLDADGMHRDYLAANAERFFGEICDILGTMQEEGIRHTHPHHGNLTLYRGKIHLIDISNAESYSLDWGEEFGVFLYFSNDFYYSWSAFESVVSWMGESGCTFEGQHMKVDWVSRIVDRYPCSIDSRYRLIERFSSQQGLVLDERVLGGMEELSALVDRYRSADRNFFPENTLSPGMRWNYQASG